MYAPLLKDMSLSSVWKAGWGARAQRPPLQLRPCICKGDNIYCKTINILYCLQRIKYDWETSLDDMYYKDEVVLQYNDQDAYCKLRTGQFFQIMDVEHLFKRPFTAYDPSVYPYVRRSQLWSFVFVVRRKATSID